jgi:hypothetical protein
VLVDGEVAAARWGFEVADGREEVGCAVLGDVWVMVSIGVRFVSSWMSSMEGGDEPERVLELDEKAARELNAVLLAATTALRHCSLGGILGVL